jgi:hypothetical protein
MIRRAKPATVTILLLISIGCAATMPSMQIRSDRNPAASFATYRSYAWASMPEQGGQWPAADDRVAFDWSVRSLVDQQMAQLGYEQVTIDRADLVVDYLIDTREQMLGDGFGDYASYVAQGGTGSRGQTWVQGYRQGTLIVEVTDPRLRTLVWYGSASAVVNPELRAQRMPKAIAQIFQSFPPRAAS